MIVVFDIDGVLADCSHRLHYLKDKNYDMFYSEGAMAGDRPIKSGFELLLAMFCNNNNVVWFFTGRPERTRQITEEWLRYYLPDDLYYRTVQMIVMRKDGDYRPSPDVKSEMFDRVNVKPDADEPILFIDDDPENIVEVCNKFEGKFNVQGLIFGTKRLTLEKKG